jgi:ferrochelatase
MTGNSKHGVVLMNLGSPDSTEVRDVKKYLDEFLMDKRVIDYPYLLRFLLVKGIITPSRSPKSAEAYKKIWGKDGSPLITLTRRLQKAVQKRVEFPVSIAMRYGNPSPKQAFDELLSKSQKLEEVILVPLYPHYAMSSYETAVVYAQQIHKRQQYPFKLSVIKPYYNNNEYINALAESIKPYLHTEYDHVLFSYHGVPERHILKGDITGAHCLKSTDCCCTSSAAHKKCYRHQCFSTTALVAQKLSLDKSKYSISFQSRLGNAEWLKPYTAKQLEEMPKQGIKKLLVACPAFISDCLETLEEIAVEGKEIFLHAGGESFTVIPCLNVHPMWVDTIAAWTRNITAGCKELILE